MTDGLVSESESLVRFSDMACSSGGWSRHPLPIGWATETRVGRPMEHRRARGSPRPAARRHARRRSLLPWLQRFVTPSSGFHPRLPLFRQRRQCVVSSDLRQGGARWQEPLEQVGGCTGFAALSGPPCPEGCVSERGLIPLRPATSEPGEEIVTSNRKDYRRYLCLTIPDCGIAMTTRIRDSSTRTLKQTVLPEDT